MGMYAQCVPGEEDIKMSGVLALAARSAGVSFPVKNGILSLSVSQVWEMYLYLALEAKCAVLESDRKEAKALKIQLKSWLDRSAWSDELTFA